MQKSILINAPKLSELGGVASHYLGLRKYFSDNIQFHTTGSRDNIPGSLLFPWDVILFIIKLLASKVDTVVLNPSLGVKALRRDYFYLKIAKFLNRRVIVFIHGWDREVESEIDKQPNSLLRGYYAADAFIVLAKEFKFKLHNWGISVPIYLTSTKVDDGLLSEFEPEARQFTNIKLLFLARIEENKGVYQALDALEIINKSSFKVSLTIVGEGSELKAAKLHAKNRFLDNVDFTGRLSGGELAEQFQKHNIYLFPSYHGEGMPTSVLEAMAFGLPVITTKNAGINDFFLEPDMGLFCEMKDSESLANSIIEIIREDSLRDISRRNFSFAKENFMASNVASKLEKIFETIRGC